MLQKAKFYRLGQELEGTIVDVLDESDDTVYDDFVEQFFNVNTDYLNVTQEQLSSMEVL